MKIISLASLTVLAAVGCAHAPGSSAPESDRLVRVAPRILAHEGLHQIEALSHTAMADGDVATEVRVCVSPSGHAESVVVKRSSGSASLDRAVTRDLRRARFARYAAPAHIRVCAPIRVVVAAKLR